MKAQKEKVLKYFTEDEITLLDKFETLRRPFDLNKISKETGVHKRNIRAIINRERPCYQYKQEVLLKIGDIIIDRLSQQIELNNKLIKMQNGATT